MPTLKVTYRMYPSEFRGLLSVLGRVNALLPEREQYGSQPDYLAALTTHAVLIDFAHRMRCSSLPDRWATRDARRYYSHTIPTAVALALWHVLSLAGACNGAEQSYFDVLTGVLVNGNVLRLSPPSPINQFHHAV